MTPRDVLLKLLTSEKEILAHPQRLEEMMRELCGKYRAEIFLLIQSLQMGVVRSLEERGATPIQVLLETQVEYLKSNLAVDEQKARWAVESWALALGCWAPDESMAVADDDPFEDRPQETVLAELPRNVVEARLRQQMKKALADKKLTQIEMDSLRETCKALGLSPDLLRQMLQEVREEQLRKALLKALDDGVISREERVDLLRLAKNLDIPENVFRRIFSQVRWEQIQPYPTLSVVTTVYCNSQPISLNGIAVLPDHSLWVSVPEHHRTWANRLSILEPDHSLLVSVSDRHQIFRVNREQFENVYAGSGIKGHRDSGHLDAQFSSPTGLAVDRHGCIWVADTGNHCIRKIMPKGDVITIAGGPFIFRLSSLVDGSAKKAQFKSPVGIALGRQDTIFVTDRDNHCIRVIFHNKGQVTTLAGNGEPGYQEGKGREARFSSPNGIAVDWDGNVYVADTGNQCVRKISPLGMVSTLLGRGAGWLPQSQGLKEPMGLVFHPKGYLVLSDSANQCIYRVSLKGAATLISGQPQIAGFTNGTIAYFKQPLAVTYNGAGEIFVVDMGNQAIRRIRALSVHPPTEPVANNADIHAVLVSPKGVGHYHRIQDAIQKEPEGTVILVRPGIYNESLVIDKSFEIIGDGGLDAVILENEKGVGVHHRSGDASFTDFIFRGKTEQDGVASILVTGGHLTVSQCNVSSQKNDCIEVCGHQAFIKITNCQVHGGKKNGLMIRDNGQAQVDNSQFYRHQHAGIGVDGYGQLLARWLQLYQCGAGCRVGNGSKADIQDSQIYDNHSHGVIFLGAARSFLRHSQLNNNQGNGVHCTEQAQVYLSDCELTQHGTGVAILGESKVWLDTCAIKSCRVAGVFIANAVTEMNKCTIWKGSPEAVGIDIITGSHVTIHDCSVQGFGIGYRAAARTHGLIKYCTGSNNNQGYDIHSQSGIKLLFPKLGT